MVFRRRLIEVMLLCLLTGVSSLSSQTPARSLADGVYAEQQAFRGQAIYRARCLSCHADNLGGRSGPPLTGDDFASSWSAKPLLELANKIRRTMPKDDTARLTSQEAADVLAYILQTGKFPSGRAELAVDDAALQRLVFPARATASARASEAASPLPSLPASGSVAQVMRGILFPSSNIIFTTQSVDPAAPKKPAESGTVGTDWLIWGGNVYKGWDLVDYAAISLSESAKLMLTPGRRCENGRMVPVSDPDWIKFTLELSDAGNAAYKASQTRNQDTISESTNQLNDSCMHCHRVYRGRIHCVKG
jgi:S-disulfanyl-L-cysteine oxidoreductase SoxD